METKREHERFTLDLAGELNVGGALVPAATRNFSRGGICVEVEGPLTEGARVAVLLFLTLDGIEDADADPVSVPATVVWCSEREPRGHTAGLRFGELSTDEVEAIDHFLARLGRR